MTETIDDSRQKAILNSAFQAFAAYGYKKTSMDDIARGAGMSRPAVYLHYKNKEAIVSKLTEVYYAEKTQAVAQALAEEGPVSEVLTKAVQVQTAGIATILASPHGLEMLDNTKSMAADIVAAGEARLAELYTDWLQRKAQAGRVRLLNDAEETGRTIAATLKGLKLIGAGAEVYEQQVAQIAALIGTGLEVR